MSAGRKLPIIIVVALGLDLKATEQLCRKLELIQVLTGSFRPLYVIDTPYFSVFRSFGYAVERIPPRASYEACEPADTYSDFVLSRIADIVKYYGARAVVPLPRGGVEDFDELAMMCIGALPQERY